MTFQNVIRIYNALLPFALILSAPGSIVKMVRRGQASRNLEQRFGRYGTHTKARLAASGSPGPLWIHAVSVGEIFLALKLIRALGDAAPHLPVVLSCTTSTGYRLAEERCDGAFTLIYNPLDLPWAVARAFREIQPRALILIEAEIWPNLLAEAGRHRVPVVLANARLSPRSETRFGKFGPLTRPLFSRLDRVLVTAPEDVARWNGLGVERDRIACTGNLKFDQQGHETPTAQIATFRTLLDGLRGTERGPVLLAGSTHPGEEKRLGEAFLEIRREFPGAFFIVVPRHFERAEEVRRDLRDLGFDPVLKTERSELPGRQEPPAAASAPRCLIVDTTGELRAWYQLADLVFIGKTFLSSEGQNPIEPILCGKPVVTGPEMKNFQLLFDRLQGAGGILRIAEPAALVPATLQLLRDPERQQAMVRAGSAVVTRDQGAAIRTAEAVLALLAHPADSLER